MMAPDVNVLKAWHDFFLLLGTAAATLVGLLFVAASVAVGFFTDDKSPAFRAFLSPTVVHFSCVLAASLLAVAPVSSLALLGGLATVDALFGVCYCGLVWRSMVRHGISRSIDREDRAMYVALPALAYAAMIAAGMLMLGQSAAGVAVLASGLGLLLVVGIRNAWDMTSWMTLRRRDHR